VGGTKESMTSFKVMWLSFTTKAPLSGTIMLSFGMGMAASSADSQLVTANNSHWVDKMISISKEHCTFVIAKYIL
jgi:hypothetical protein